MIGKITGMLALGVTLALGSGPAGALHGHATYQDVLDDARRAGATAQVQALADGVLTRAELDAAVTGMYACFTAEGISHGTQGTNPVDGWRPLYSYDGLREADVDACRTRNFSFVEQAYPMVNAARMDPALMATIQSCLQRRGAPTTGREANLDDLVPGGADDVARFAQVNACATEDPGRYPNLMWTFQDDPAGS